MSGLPVALRIKRRRDCAAPSEIILETNTRPDTTQEALAASLQQSLAVSQVSHDKSSAQEGRAKKRCRFVLVASPAAAVAADSSAGAATHEPGQLDGPVLELWHSSGLTAAAAADSNCPTAADSATAATAPSSSLDLGHSDDQSQAVYASMLQQYLQEQQQPLHQPRTYHRPSRRALHAAAPHSSTNVPQHSDQASSQKHEQLQGHQQQQEQQMLPTYMTKGMLQHYGLWQGAQRTAPQQQHQQQQQQEQLHDFVAASSGSAPDKVTKRHAAAAAAARPDNAAADGSEQGPEQDYTYDMYVAVGLDEGLAWEAHADWLCDNSNSHPGGSGSDPAAGACLPVVQVWEDELLELQQDWAVSQGAAAAEADSEDSNAEDHYANDYPEEEDGSYQDSMGSSGEAEDDGARRGGFDVTGGIGFYQPGSGKGQRSHACGRDESYVGADESSEFDVDEYESSGDEQGEEGAAGGPAWLRKHCPAYGAGAMDSGRAWRSMLAQQFVPGSGR